MQPSRCAASLHAHTHVLSAVGWSVIPMGMASACGVSSLASVAHDRPVPHHVFAEGLGNAALNGFTMLAP